MYACDFETIVSDTKTRVWAWCAVDISTEETFYGTSIDTFMEEICVNNETCYFHNLKFDGAFIVDWLFRHGYDWYDKRKLDPMQFSTLISDMGSWYSINIRLPNAPSGFERQVKILDSLKILPMKVAEMPKSFPVGLEKLDLDYEGYREEGHELTEDERAYIRNDTMILARSLRFMFTNGMTKMTTASNAMNYFKNQLGKAEYKRMYPKLSPIEDRDIRRSYKGGFTYLNPKYKDAHVGKGKVYDVNSMYPWAMKFCRLPYGEPWYFNGKYEKNDIYDLYVQCFSCEFKLKPNRVPSIQIKGSFMYRGTEYLTQSNGETLLTLTNVDLDLFFHNYDVTVYEWIGGYMFKSMVGMFAEYIDYWYDVKTNSRIEGNKGMERIAKLMLNSLYGKFGSNPEGRSKIPYLDEEKDRVCFRYGTPEERTAYYLPVASFITSYCRDKIIRSAEALGDRFIYADTDSLHVLGDEEVTGIDIDNKRLGAFKLEEEFSEAIFIRQKTYCEMVNGNLDVKCAGMPSNVKSKVTLDNFKAGSEFSGKLMPKIITGGVVLKETTFKIQKESTTNIN